MPGIFISYRRKGTVGWAGHLYADFCTRFGSSQVFMDINDGIPRGSDFAKELTKALSSCDVLLALIDTEWVSCTCADGRRRLDVPDDWVRNEIAIALRRNITVMPVLLGGVKLPQKDELPEDIQSLCNHLASEISDNRWNYDVDAMVKDILRRTPLKLQENDNVAFTNTGLRLLLELNKNSVVADEVSRSKEVFENTYRQTIKLKLFKTIHDALHIIEFDCLRVIEEGKPTNTLRPMKIKFQNEARRIQEAIQPDYMDSTLCDNMKEQLELVAAAFKGAVDAPGDATSYGRVVSELRALLSDLPSRLNYGIADAAKGLSLDRLVDLMKTVQGEVSAAGPGRDPQLEPFLQGINALQRLRDELKKRVEEHTQLQGLDSKLRTVCTATTQPGALASEWGRIKKVRSRLLPPFFPELEEANDDLLALESQIEAEVAKGDEQEVLNSMKAYFQTVGMVFKDEDTNLMEFCSRLSEVSQPLRAILAVC